MQDIRSFFTVGAKAKVPAAPNTPSPAANKRKTIVLDSDSDDDGRKKKSHVSKGEANSGKKDASKSKKRRIIESSDDEAENQQKIKKPTQSSKLAKLASTAKTLKPVTVSSVFGDGPIKRVEKERKPPKIASDKALLDNADDDDDLMEIDEALLSPKAIKVEKKPTLKKEKSSEKLLKTKSKEKLETKSPAKGHHRSNSSNSLKSPSVKTEKASPAKERKETKEGKHSSSAPKDHTRSESNRSHTDSDEKEFSKRKKNGPDTPSSSKKPPKKASSPSEELDTSGTCIFCMIFLSLLLRLLSFLVFFSVYDPDQERHERKRAAAMLYQKFQKRAGPSNPGSKEIPQGTPTCLSGMTFVITGVLESMEKDEAAQVIKDFGGRVTSAVSGKTTHLISGEDSGPAKLAKAEQMGIQILSEDDLLDLIREKSGLPTKKKKTAKPAKETKVEKKIKSEDVTLDKKREKPESPQKKMKSPAKPVIIELDDEPSVSETKIKQEPTAAAKDVALAWVDKYKPKTLKEIVGQQGVGSNCEK